MIWPNQSSSETNDREDQTIFINQEPWLEDGKSQPLPSPITNDQPLSTSVSKYKKIFIIGGGFLVLTFLIIAALLILKGKEIVPVEIIPTPVPSISPNSSDPLSVRFQQLRTDLKAADPGKRDLPFPPVDTSLQLNYGEKKR
jgi:hypothetical protein